MAFKKTVALQVTDTDDFLGVIKTQLLAMGWVDHDDQISGSDYFVVYSDGEGKCPARVYMKIEKTGSNTLDLRRYAYWNNSTQTGVFDMSQVSYRTLNVDDDSSFYVWIYGNKDSFVLITLITGVYDGYFCHRFYPIWNQLGRLTQSVTTGTDKVIQLGSGQADNFSIGAMVSFFDTQNDSHAGRSHRSTITDITPSADTITVDEVFVAMQSGALCGYVVDFHVCGTMPGWACSSLMFDAYTTQGTTGLNSANITELISWNTLDPDSHGSAEGQGPSNLFTSFPMKVGRSASNIGIAGLLSGVMAKSPYTEQSSYEDTCAIGLEVDGLTATGGTSNTITVSGASWNTNIYQGKALITIGGTGNGQIRKITSNNTTSLTVSGDFSVIPDNTTTFVIARGGARHFGWGNDTYSQVYQEVPAPPTHPADNT
jgi:hypothetical protein